MVATSLTHRVQAVASATGLWARMHFRPRARLGLTRNSQTVSCRGVPMILRNPLLAALFAVLGLSSAVLAAPIVGPGQSGIMTITCKVEPNGATTCVVTQGEWIVCAATPDELIRRSYQRFGCTGTIDYWKTHTEVGPKPFDTTWRILGPKGADTNFFLSDQSYYNVLETDAQGKAYYVLAQAYIAAKLNQLTGADLPEDVLAVFDAATALFETQSPAEVTESDDTARQDLRKQFLELATVLDLYNKIPSGPGRCTEETTPFSSADIGKRITGVISGDTATVVSVDQRYGRGNGVVKIRPDDAGDRFNILDEDFLISGVLKGEFTSTFNECVDVRTGESTHVRVGGLPSPPDLPDQSFIDLDRSLRILIALNQPDQEAEALGAIVTEAGPQIPEPSAEIEPTLVFPSAELPPPPTDIVETVSGGSGVASVIVPFVVGLGLEEAQAKIVAASLTIGTVTIENTTVGSLGNLMIRTAKAQAPEGTVLKQDPVGGTAVPEFTPVALDVAGAPIPISEPASLILFALGLVILAMLLRRRKRTQS